jgi:hypothetical protein
MAGWGNDVVQVEACNRLDGGFSLIAPPLAFRASLLWREVGAVSGHQGALVVMVNFIGNPQPAFGTLHAPHRARPAAGESLERLGGALPRPQDRRGGQSDEARTR